MTPMWEPPRTTMQSPRTLHKHPSPGVSAALLGLCLAASTQAADMGGVAIHGSVSATASYSPDYNYLGDTKDSLDLNQTELILNGTKRFDNGIKIAAQIYAYELAGYDDIAVDFANLDYSFRQELGVRVGRNKLPVGLYNEVQDLDQVRTFASLPLNFYPRTMRAINASYDGAALYGNLSTGKAGSFDYQTYAGYGQHLDEDMPLMRGFQSDSLYADRVYGASLFWNTPAEGLRVGYSYQHLPKIDQGLGVAKGDIDYEAQVFSAEYSVGKWVFATEYKLINIDVDITNLPVPTEHIEEREAYAQVTYQLTEKVGLGAYYAHSDYDTGTDQDTAFAVAYSVQPWWLVKAEVHLMDGINKLGQAGDLNPGATDDTWTYFVLKTTVSF